VKLLPYTLIAGAALALAGCGGAAKTVTVTRTITKAASVQTSTSSSRSQTTTATGTAPSTSSTTSTSIASTTTTATSASATTRTETGPAFVTTNPNSPAATGAGLTAAIAVLARHGYTPVETSSYSTADTLRVLIGRRQGGVAPAERAFFFDQTTYLGTDAAQPSASVTVASHLDAEVVLSYAIYKPGASSPSGRRLVHFALDMGSLSPVEAIPSLAERR